jgi:hypothetical protein
MFEKFKELLKMEKNEIEALIESMGIEYKALFVPFSQSRNSKEKNLSINWLITLSKDNQMWTTDYMQGIAHLPNYSPRSRNNADYQIFLRQCVETGKCAESNKFPEDYRSLILSKRIPAPKLTDILIDIMYIFVMDATAINCRSFEEWAEIYGYNKDSRKAEQTYNACRESGLKLRAMIGNDNLEKLRNAYQDY